MTPTANCCISSIKLFHLVQTPVYSSWRLRCEKKNHLKSYTSGSIFRQNPHSPGKCSSQMLEDCPGGYWRFDLIGAALWALKFRKRGLSLKTCDFIKFGTPTKQELWRFATDRILFTFCSGAFALYFRPYRWVFDSLSAPIRRNLPSIKKRRANSPEVRPGREWAQLELTDTLDKDSFCFIGTLRWLTVSVLVRKSRIFTW